jgi:lipopolysaccharide/colanic/teichoic acid biosynthesis glycosyltransferase
VKRAFDIVVALTGLVITGPLLASIAVAIRTQLGAPVLFRQRRTGKHGAEFTIYKFRTMRPLAQPGEPDASRTPPIGRMLRTTSLDELPQLWNVLRGDMSLIGPRPTLPEQVANYDTFQRRRLDVAPGLTGYAQVKGRNALSWAERIEFDVWYIDNRSVWLDLWILLMTAVKLARPEGITGEGGVNPGFPVPSAGAVAACGDRQPVTVAHSPARSGERGRAQRDCREVPDVVDRRGDRHGCQPGGGDRGSRVPGTDPQPGERPQEQCKREAQSR